MLSDFAGCRAQCGYEGFLKEIYVPVNGNFQEPYTVEYTAIHCSSDSKTVATNMSLSTMMHWSGSLQ